MRQVRHNRQSYQDAWLEWDSHTSIPDQIMEHVRRKYWVYDSDTCGSSVYQFVVRENGSETYWFVTHDWWIEHDPEWACVNEFDISQMLSVDFEYPRVDRDWLKLTQR